MTNRPEGSDGNDYRHREQVASRYKISAQTKIYVKFAIYMHFMISALIIIQLLSFHFNTLFASIEDYFPEPQKWEYVWILSLVSSLIGYFSLSKNRLFLIKIYYYGQLAFGLIPIVCTVILNASDFLRYTQSKESTKLFNGFPLIVLWYIFLFVALQIHGLGIYNARVLMNAWKDTGKKKK